MMLELFTKAWVWVQSRRDAEEGATAIEYGLIAALVSVVIITVLTVVGTNLTTVFSKIGDALGDAGGP